MTTSHYPTQAEWERIVALGPGVWTYNDKKTLFYNGEILWKGGVSGRPLIYNRFKRRPWEVIIVLPGVEVIPEFTFHCCGNVKKVIIPDTVRRIEKGAFSICRSLVFVKLSINLQYIGLDAFWDCGSLTSIFIPPSCREIGDRAFRGCHKLTIQGTAFLRPSRYPTQAEWERIVASGPGVRMYNGKRTLFYNGEKLWDQDAREYLIYNKKERRSWQVIIVLRGVEVIPKWTFHCCGNVKKVIMADTVKRIERWAFSRCKCLEFIRLSRNLEYIGAYAFCDCESLTSIFIPPSCREIIAAAFSGCSELIILSVPQETRLGNGVIEGTALKRASPFDEDGNVWNISRQRTNEVNAWIKNINRDSDAYSLHLLCCSYYPDVEQVYALISDNGLGVMTTPNEIGVSPSQYLGANPYVDFHQQTLINRYILEKMGEIQP